LAGEQRPVEPHVLEHRRKVEEARRQGLLP
jgi:hypothetical protein